MVVTTEQSSVPATMSPSKRRIIHGSFMIVSVWIAAIEVTYCRGSGVGHMHVVVMYHHTLPHSLLRCSWCM